MTHTCTQLHMHGCSYKHTRIQSTQTCNPLPCVYCSMTISCFLFGQHDHIMLGLSRISQTVTNMNDFLFSIQWCRPPYCMIDRCLNWSVKGSVRLFMSLSSHNLIHASVYTYSNIWALTISKVNLSWFENFCFS